MQNKKAIYFFVSFLVFFSGVLFSKENPDTLSPAAITAGDTAIKRTKWPQSKTATVLSACFPGLGQAYNRKYWKMPVIYGLMGTFGYFTIKNHSTYKDYSNSLRSRYDGDPGNDTFLQYSDENLVTLKRQSRRYRDLSILGAAAIYLIQIVDANVDGHLANFDVDNISFNLTPMEMNVAGRGFQGLTLSMNF